MLAELVEQQTLEMAEIPFLSHLRKIFQKPKKLYQQNWKYEFTSFWAENDISHLIIFGNLIRWNDNNIEIFAVFSHYGFDCALNDKNKKRCISAERLWENSPMWNINTIVVWPPRVSRSSLGSDQGSADNYYLLLLFLVARNNDWLVVLLFNFWNVSSVSKRESGVASSRPALVQFWHPLRDCIWANNKGGRVCMLPWFEFINVAWRSGTK